MLISKSHLNYLLTRLIKESNNLNAVYGGSTITRILNYNSIEPGFHNQVAFIPFSSDSVKFLSLMEKRNGTEFGNVLEPIIAQIMVQDGYANTKDLNISAGGGETVLADIMAPANPVANAVMNPNPGEVEINDVYISAKASKDFFDLAGANYIGKLPKLINQSYIDPQKAIINSPGTKIIKCKLGAAYAGAYYQPSMAGGVGLKDDNGDKTIVPIVVKLFFPNIHNLVICKDFQQKIPNTPANREIAKDTIDNYILTRQTGASASKISQKADDDVKLLQSIIGRCNVTDINSLKRFFVFDWSRVTGAKRLTEHLRFEHLDPNPSKPGFNPQSVTKTNNPLSSLFRPTDFNKKNFPTVLGNLPIDGSNSESDSILKPGGVFVDILDDAKPVGNPSGLSIMESTLKSLKDKAKQKTVQIIDSYFTTNATDITSIGTQTNSSTGGVQYLTLNLQFYNALKKKLDYLGENTGNQLVADTDPSGNATGIKDWAVFVGKLKQALKNLSNNYYDSITISRLKTAMTNAMKEYNKTNIIGTPVGTTKQRFAGYAGAPAAPTKLEVENSGTPVPFALEDSKPGYYNPKKGEEASDLRVWTVNNAGKFFDDVTNENPSNASAFAEKIYVNDSDYTIKNYLILFQAGTSSAFDAPGGGGSEAYATKIINNLASGAMTKTPRPQGNVLAPQPDPASQASVADIQALKTASETLILASQTAADATLEGQKVASGQYAGLDKLKEQAKLRYKQIITQLAQLADDDLTSESLLNELEAMRSAKLLPFTESIRLSIKSIRQLIEAELRRVETTQMLDKKTVIFATNYYNQLSNLIKISIENPSDVNYQNVVEKAQVLIDAATKLKIINVDNDTDSGEVINVDFRQPGLVGSEDQLVGESKLYQKILFELLKYSK